MRPSIRQDNGMAVKLESAENPVRQDVFVVELSICWVGAAEEATFPLADVPREPLRAEKQDPTVGRDDRTVLGSQ